MGSTRGERVSNPFRVEAGGGCVTQGALPAVATLGYHLQPLRGTEALRALMICPGSRVPLARALTRQYSDA